MSIGMMSTRMTELPGAGKEDPKRSMGEET